MLRSFFYKCAPVPLAIYIVWVLGSLPEVDVAAAALPSQTGRFGRKRPKFVSRQLRTVGQICYLLEFLAHLGTVVSCIQDARFDIIVTSDLSSRRSVCRRSWIPICTADGCNYKKVERTIFAPTIKSMLQIWSQTNFGTIFPRFSIGFCHCKCPRSWRSCRQHAPRLQLLGPSWLIECCASGADIKADELPFEIHRSAIGFQSYKTNIDTFILFCPSKIHIRSILKRDIQALQLLINYSL